MIRKSLFLLVVVCSSAQATDYKLYFLGGQSNMDGYGHVSELPEANRSTVDLPRAAGQGRPAAGSAGEVGAAATGARGRVLVQRYREPVVGPLRARADIRFQAARR